MNGTYSVLFLVSILCKLCSDFGEFTIDSNTDGLRDANTQLDEGEYLDQSLVHNGK